jgi:peptidoglycan-associated lipoprotein
MKRQWRFLGKAWHLRSEERLMRQVRGVITSGMLILALFLIQGCAIKWWWGSESGEEGLTPEELVKEPMIKEIPPGDGQLTDSRTSPAMRSELLSRDATGLTDETLTDILFDFDQDTISMDAMRVLEANAKHLQQKQITHLLLEGRGDEFGTSAYNLVLGERRARNVKTYLRELGLSIDVNTISYGKDRPLCFEHSSACRRKNRSVHFVVQHCCPR